MLSVIIITKNCEPTIRECLASVSFADEIVVLDSGSDDNTVRLCREFTDKVFETDWPGFGKQKNRALEKATGDWVLALDADEVIPDALAKEILATLANSDTTVAYSMPRHSSFCGTLIRHGDWKNDVVLRLFKRDKARFKDVAVHERLLADGPCVALKNAMLHYPYQNAEQVLEKLNHYSALTAQLKHQQGKRSNLPMAILRGMFTFFRGYVLRCGFLDGAAGFMLAKYNAECTYYRYVKLMLLNKDGS